MLADNNKEKILEVLSVVEKPEMNKRFSIRDNSNTEKTISYREIVSNVEDIVIDKPKNDDTSDKALSIRAFVGKMEKLGYKDDGFFGRK